MTFHQSSSSSLRNGAMLMYAAVANQDVDRSPRALDAVSPAALRKRRGDGGSDSRCGPGDDGGASHGEAAAPDASSPARRCAIGAWMFRRTLR